MIMLFALAAVKMGAQEVDTVRVAEYDTTTINLGKTKIIIIGDDSFVDDTTDFDTGFSDKSELTFWDGIDFGINGYFFGDNFDLDTPEGQEHLEVNYAFASRYFSLNLGETKVRLIKDYVGVYTGLGLQYQSYKLKNDYTLSMVGDSIVAFQDSTINLRKNKFRTAYLVIPLMLEFNTSRYSDRSFHLAAGVIGGVNLGNMYKQKLEVIETNERDKRKVKSDWDVAPFKLDASVRFGYGDFTMFANYALTDLFESDKNPQLRPFAAGITLNF